MMNAKFIHIAVCPREGCEPDLFALDNEGQVWERYCAEHTGAGTEWRQVLGKRILPKTAAQFECPEASDECEIVTRFDRESLEDGEACREVEILWCATHRTPVG